MSAHHKAANRKFANLIENLRTFSLPRGWVLQTGIVLNELQAGSWAVENRDQILALMKHLKRLKTKLAPRKRGRPKKALSELPPYTRAEAFGRRLVLQAYHEALSSGLIPAQAERIARMMSLLIFGKTLCGKTVRRLAHEIEARGGIEHSPIEFFATSRSCPHPNQRRSLPNALKRASKV